MLNNILSVYQTFKKKIQDCLKIYKVGKVIVSIPSLFLSINLFNSFFLFFFCHQITYHECVWKLMITNVKNHIHSKRHKVASTFLGRRRWETADMPFKLFQTFNAFSSFSFMFFFLFLFSFYLIHPKMGYIHSSFPKNILNCHKFSLKWYKILYYIREKSLMNTPNLSCNT